MRRRRWTWFMALTLLGVVFLLLNFTPAMALQAGDKAPDFSLPGSDGKQYSLASYRGRQAVVLAWFSKAFTEG